MEDNTENPLKKKPKLFIIGAGPAGFMTTTRRVEEILELQNNKGAEVVIVDSKESFAKEFTEAEMAKSKPLNEPKPLTELLKPAPIVIRNYRSEDMLEDNCKIYNNEVNNPWPSPKGRKGKKRY
jgi:predicted flavoprotein YhiN